jgi:hypothetical protein
MGMNEIMVFWKIPVTTPVPGKVPEKVYNLMVLHHVYCIDLRKGNGTVFSFLSKDSCSGYCIYIPSTQDGSVEKRDEKQGCSGIDQV